MGILFLVWAGASLVVVAPAIVNGFPLIFFDSHVYFSGLRHQWEGHPPFYSIFVYVIAKLATLLAVPFVQGACALVTFELALRSLAPAASAIARALGVLAILALTQLPWLASWIMPDLFAGLGVVAVVAILLAREAPPFWHMALLSMMALFSALVATANVLTLVLVAVFCLLVRRVWLGWQVPLRLVLGTCILAASAFALPIAWNTVKWNAPRLNAGSGALLIGKLVDAGIAQRYLASNCTRIPHPICPYLDELLQAPTGAGLQIFLWKGDPPLAWKLNAWRDPDGTFSSLASSIVRTYPSEVLGRAMDDILHLFTRLTLGFGSQKGYGEGELQPFPRSEGSVGVVRDRLERRGHGEMLEAFDHARQQTGQLEALFPKKLYQISVIASYATLLLMLVIALLRRERHLSAVAAVVLAAVLLGMAVHGGLVGPYARYSVKLSWLAGFAVLVWALRVYNSQDESLALASALQSEKELRLWPTESVAER